MRKNIPSYKLPKMFFIANELPRTVNGKVKREKLREILNESELNYLKKFEF